MFLILFLAFSCCRGEVGSKPSGEELRNALLLTTAAGLSTVIGAGIACCVGWEDLKAERSTFLAAWLSFAASVMVYVSLIEIWQKSLLNFEEVTEDEQLAHIYTSLTFFGGVALGSLCSKIVHCFDNSNRKQVLPSQTRTAESNPSHLVNEQENGQMVQMRSQTGPGHAQSQTEEAHQTDPSQFRTEDPSQTGCEQTQSQKTNEVVVQFKDADKRKAQLLRIAIVTAISVGLHNFPEGIVTFLAALADWKVGVVTAVAIAMHNILEGISIAIPYCYASGSRWKAFVIAFFSGVAEPIGALLGWAIFDDLWGPEVFGLMFGLTAGIMVFVSYHELLPLARKNDPNDKVTTTMIFVGMLVMDVSLCVAA